MKRGKVFAWALLASSLALALFPWKQEKAPGVTVVYCIDSSASLSNQERVQMLQAAKASMSQARDANATIEIICFGNKVTRPKKLPEKLFPQLASDLYPALQLALAIVDKHSQPGKIFLFSDGSGIDHLSELAAQCVKHDAPLFVWTPPLRKDWKFISLNAPEQISTEMNVPISLRYRSDFQGKMRLRIYAGKQLYLAKTIEVKATEQGFIKFLAPPLPEGGAYLFAQATGDIREENNRAFTFVRVVPVSPVLLVSEEDPPLKRALAAQQIPTKLVSWQHLPLLDNYPVAILHWPMKKRINKRMQNTWRDYLKRGGSILICESELNLPWVPVLPLKKSRPRPKSVKTPDNPVKKEKAKAEIEFRTAAIVFVIDCSRSMEGDKIRLARESAFSAISRLWIQDLIGVIKFHNNARWVVPLGRGTDLKWITRRLESIVPEGGTSILPALTLAYQALKSAHTHIKHVILLSDGQDENHVFVRKPLWDLVDKMRVDGITITSIGIGGGYDEYLMPKLAEWSGGEFYFADKYHELPVAVLRDIDRVLGVRKLPPEIQIPELPKLEIPPIKTIAIAPTQSFKNRYPVKKRPGELLSPFEKFPPLKQLYPTRMRKGAIAELTTGNFPVLVRWEWEKGRVMAWNSKLDEWSAWSEYARFWARVVRFLDARSFVIERFSLRCQQTEANKVLVRLQGYGMEDQNVMIKSDYPFYHMGDSVWQAVFRTSDVGKWQNIALKVERKGKEITALKTAFALPFQAEFAKLRIARKALDQMAQKTGGKSLGNGSLFPPSVAKKGWTLNAQNWEFIFTWLAFFSSLAWLLTTELQ